MGTLVNVAEIEAAIRAYNAMESPVSMFKTTETGLDMAEQMARSQEEDLAALQEQYREALEQLDAQIRAEKLACEMFAARQAEDAAALKRELEVAASSDAATIAANAQARYDTLKYRVLEAEAESVRESYTGPAAREILALQVYRSFGLSLSKAAKHSPDEIWEGIGILCGTK